MKIINRFREKYHFLSNFYYHEPSRTLEHYYQAMKTTDPFDQIRILSALDPAQAKKLGRQCKLRPEWELIKYDVMLELVRMKFRDNVELCAKLLATGNAELIEGNTWGDTYWGVSDGRGQNRLGKILMQVRKEMTKSET